MSYLDDTGFDDDFNLPGEYDCLNFYDDDIGYMNDDYGMDFSTALFDYQVYEGDEYIYY